MRVVVPALSEDSVAKRCLAAEGFDPYVAVLSGTGDYARLLADLWQDGETFVVVEDDIAPWPGAVKAMLRCPHHWCGHHYCLPGRWDVDEASPHYQMMGTNGCFKVAQEVMQAAPKLYERWEHHDWNMVDVAMTAALRHVFGLDGAPSEYTFHVHTPPVAHAMHYRPEARSGRNQAAAQHQQLHPEVLSS